MNFMKSVFPIRAGTILLALLSCHLWLAQQTFALDPAKSFSQYKQIIWNEEKGLPQSLVLAMVQTRDGYLWFATLEGLVRFNGSSFKVFDLNNTPTFKTNFISSILEDRSGNLWVGTGKGLYIYQDGEFSVYTTENGLSQDFVNTLYEDSKGNLWMVTGGKLTCLKDGKITSYDTKDGILSGVNNITLVEDADGGLWIGTNQGLFHFLNDQFKPMTVADGFIAKRANIVFRDKDNRLLIGTENGLWHLENGKFISDERFKGKSVRTIRNDQAGALWVAGDFGIIRIFGNMITALENRKGFSSGIFTMLEDTEGSFWLGTQTDGVIQLVESKFASYTTADGLLDDLVFSIYQNEQKDIWISTQKGLSRFRNNIFDLNLTSRNGLPEIRMSCVFADKDGNLWVGTAKGLIHLQNNRVVPVKGIENLSDKVILVLHKDSENNLWIGTNSGLSVYDLQSKSGEIISYDKPEQLRNARIYSIIGNRSKGLWLGTNKGLFYLKDDQMTAFPMEDGSANNMVMSLYEDESGVLWIGTFGGGLVRLKDGKFSFVNSRNGLFNDIAYTILPDDNGNLWISCNRGIFRVSKTSVNDFLDGKRQDIESAAFGTTDGMKSAETNGGFQPSALKAHDGKLWFPTIRGLVVIDPHNIAKNLKPPPVYLETVMVDSKTASMNTNESFEADTQRLEFRFAALSFIAPEKVNYRYRLEGYDNDWMNAGNHQEAFYTNLPPGNYTFRVIASNNDGVWNETGANYSFDIKPHIYETWLFLVACLFAVGIIIAAVHFRRVRSLRLRHEAVLNERYRIARELHDTLLQGFVGVSSQLSVVAAQFQETPEIAERHLKIARNMIRHSVTEARRSVQNLRTDETEDELFTEILKKTVNRVKEGSSLKTEIEISGTPFEMPSETTHHLLLIVEEATVNAIKHAEAANLKIICTYEDTGFRLEIIDDGKGFGEKDVFSTLNGHFGIVGMMERAEKVGGELRVQENPTGGTKIVFASRNAAANTKSRFTKLTSGFKKLREKLRRNQ